MKNGPFKIVLVLLLTWSSVWAEVATYNRVTELYVATFNRAPDSAGLKWWVESGYSLETIALRFFYEPETLRKYPPAIDNETFVKTIYHNLFNREPDPGGLKWWVGELDSGRRSKDILILDAINGAQGKDILVLSNKTEVGLAFAKAGLNDAAFSKSIMSEITYERSSVDRALERIATYSETRIAQFHLDGDGGTFKTSEISLTFPAGTIASESEISITKISKDDKTSFRIDGLPAKLYKDVTVSLTGNENFSADTMTKYKVAKSCYAISIKKNVDCISLLENRIDGNRLTVTIPADSTANNTVLYKLNTEETITRTIEPVSVGRVDNGHFTLYLEDSVTRDDVTTKHIFDTLESFRSFLYLSGMDIANISNHYPIYFTDKSEDSVLIDALGYMTLDMSKSADTKLVISSDLYNKMKDGELEKKTLDRVLLHEYFHSGQYNSLNGEMREYYENETPIIDALMEASSTSVEHIVYKSCEDGVPPNEYAFNLFPLFGLSIVSDEKRQKDIWLPQNGVVYTPSQVGYGMGLFMYYIVLKSHSWQPIAGLWTDIIAKTQPPKNGEHLDSTKLLEDLLYEYADDLGLEKSEDRESLLEKVWSDFILVYSSARMKNDCKWPMMKDSDTFVTYEGDDKLAKRFYMPPFSMVHITLDNLFSKQYATLEFSIANDKKISMFIHTLYGTPFDSNSMLNGNRLTIPPKSVYRFTIASNRYDEDLALSIRKVDDKCSDSEVLIDGRCVSILETKRCPIEYDPSLPGDRSELSTEIGLRDKDGDGHYEDRWYCRYYSDTKTIWSESPFLNDEWNGWGYGWYRSHKLKSKSFYRDDKKIGNSYMWYESGAIMVEENTRYDSSNNCYRDEIWYYESGGRSSESHYVNDKLDGERKQWYENGTLKLCEIYDMGKYVGVCK